MKPCVNLLFGEESSLLVPLWPPVARDEAGSKAVVPPQFVSDAAGDTGGNAQPEDEISIWLA